MRREREMPGFAPQTARPRKSLERPALQLQMEPHAV